MPNHVTNIVEIKGDTDTLQACLLAIKNDDPRPDYSRIIDFEKILPMPELLSHIGSGRVDIDGQSYDEWYFDPDPDNEYLTINRVLTGPEYRELQKYPERNWYDWSCANWGTKWNAYDQSITEETTGKVASGVTLQFDTAWASPEPIITTLAKMFPTLSFKLTYADEDLGYNVGEVVYSMGYKVQESYPEGGSNPAYEIALRVKPYAKDYIKMIDGEYQYVDEDEYDEQEVA